jgi:hypothetical protein
LGFWKYWFSRVFWTENTWVLQIAKKLALDMELGLV